MLALNPVRLSSTTSENKVLVEQAPPAEAVMTASPAETSQAPPAAKEESHDDSAGPARNAVAPLEAAAVLPAPEQVQMHCCLSSP